MTKARTAYTQRISTSWKLRGNSLGLRRHRGNAKRGHCQTVDIDAVARGDKAVRLDDRGLRRHQRRIESEVDVHVRGRGGGSRREILDDVVESGRFGAEATHDRLAV